MNAYLNLYTFLSHILMCLYAYNLRGHLCFIAFYVINFLISIHSTQIILRSVLFISILSPVLNYILFMHIPENKNKRSTVTYLKQI